MEGIDKKTLEVLGCIRQDEKLINLYKMFSNELGDCRDYVTPNKTARKYGIDRGSLLDIVLEQYHQIRLKDNE